MSVLLIGEGPSGGHITNHRSPAPITAAPWAVGALAFYNVIFVSSGVVLVLIRVFFGTRADSVFEAMNRLFAVWGKRLLIAAMVVLGLVMVADGVGWLLGRQLLPVG